MNVANQDRGSGLDLLGMIKKLQEPLEVFEQFLRGLFDVKDIAHTVLRRVFLQKEIRDCGDSNAATVIQTGLKA